MSRKNYYSNLIFVFLGIIAAGLFVSACLDTTGESIRTYQFGTFVFVLLLLGVIFRKYLPKDFSVWAIAGGSFLKLSYICYTPVWLRQHDVIDFGYHEGHAAYIEYLLNNRHLPDFDVRQLWGFFQPPLHHILAACWMWLQRRLGVAEKIMQENVQVLTFSYMVITVIVTYLICKEMNMKKRGTFITMLITSFHPMFIILSGSINNDALALCLSMISVYVALLWYKTPRISTIVVLALSVSLAMFAKLTSALVAPGIAALMIYSLIKNRERLKSYIVQFLCFGIIAFPIGLFWPLRNAIGWGVPINYIPQVGEQLEHSGFVSRVLDIRMTSVYPSLVSLGDSYDEYNTVVQMMKSSLFGEYNYGQISPLVTPFAIVLFAVSVVLALLSLYATVTMIFSKKSMMTLDYKLFFGSIYFVFVIGYLSFSLGYSNFSAQDFRYAAIAIIIEALFLGLWSDESKEKPAKIIQYLCIIFAASSSCVYLLIGIL